MGNSVYIVSVDAKDLFLANYSSPNSKEYSVKLAGSDHNDQFNTRRFVNTLDYSLDLIKLREVYEKVYRRMDFTFSKRGKEYCRRVINVTFKYSVKEFNRFFDNTYIKYGYLPQDVQLTDNICIKDGELIAVRVGSPVENPASPQELGDLFVFDNGMYRLGKTMKVLLTVAQLRNRLYQDGFTCDGIVFRRFKRSSGSSRIGKCLFIDEQLYPRMHKWELCGLKVKEGQEIDLAALEAYIALTLSSIVGTIPLRPENFLVIDDYKSVFKDRVVATRIGSDIQAAVRAGVASQFFKVGDQISVSNGSNTLVWDIIGIDEDIPANPSLKHSMTLQLHDLWPTAMVYDAPEATWYIDSKTWPSGLPAGVYQFTLPAGYDTANGGGGTYNFTLTKPVPTGGQVKVGWNYNTQVTANKVTTYASVGATDILESVDIVSGATGTAMPALSTTAVTSNTNCVHRMRYGSNNWKQSGMRQWLNSDGAANTWWKAQTVFDRPTNASSAGFLNGMDAEFLAVIGEVRKDTQQSISDNYGINNNKEKFFLLSRPEAYMGIERSTDGSEGTVYSFYKDYSDLTAPGTGKDNNRIKYRSGGATYWWLRSPNAGNGNDVRNVNPGGSLNSNNAYNSYGVAPACCII